MIDTQHCLICNKHNKTLYWHEDPQTHDKWVWCNACNRAYSLFSYVHMAGISLAEFLKGDFKYEESKPNEVQVQAWPARFIPLSHPLAKPGVDYIKSRGLTLEGDWYYDSEREGIVFPYYYNNHFVGAQTRFITPRVYKDGEVQKIDTMPGTRLGMLIYGWNQAQFTREIKNVVVCEGAFNAIAINQALNLAYGGISRNPWVAVACSGSGATKHHQEVFKELKEKGIRIIVAPDTDEAGMKMLKKYKDAGAATHYALTGMSEDWNDVLKTMTHLEFAKWFVKQVKKVNDEKS